MKKKSSARSVSQRRNRTRLVILTTIALVVLSGLYLIGERSESGTTFSQQSRTDEHSPSQKKFRATRNLVIDEATGNPRKPTDAELDQLLATLEKLANTSTEGLREYPLEKGGYGMDLQWQACLGDPELRPISFVDFQTNTFSISFCYYLNFDF